MRGVELEKACFIGVLLQFVVSKGHPRREINEFAKLASASGESLQRANQTPVVVNNSGLRSNAAQAMPRLKTGPSDQAANLHKRNS